MTDTTIKISTEVRDRLAQLAREQGTTIRDLVTELAGARLTRAELDARGAAARAYIKAHLCPGITDEDLDAGEQLWQDLAAGKVTSL